MHHVMQMAGSNSGSSDGYTEEGCTDTDSSVATEVATPVLSSKHLRKGEKREVSVLIVRMSYITE